MSQGLLPRALLLCQRGNRLAQRTDKERARLIGNLVSALWFIMSGWSMMLIPDNSGSWFIDGQMMVKKLILHF